MAAEAADYIELKMCEVPEFHCASAGCDVMAWNQDELKMCEGCGRMFCADHVEQLGGLPFCADCAVCEHEGCAAPAVMLCDYCGELACSRHLQSFDLGVDPETGYHDTGEACSACLPRRAA